MGANIGSQNERLPVNRRTFDTEISFVKQTDYIEIGVKTIVSESSDTVADYEVFRPTVVKELVENGNIRLIQGGFILDKKPLEIKTKADAERLFNLYNDKNLNFPLVIVSDTETKGIKSELHDFKPDSASLNIKGEFLLGNLLNISTDTSTFDFDLKKSNKNATFQKEKPKKVKEKSLLPKQEVKKEKSQVFDYISLADKLVGFAIIVFIDESLIKHVENKLHTSFDYGKISVIRNKEVIEEYSYSDYSKDMKQFFQGFTY